MIFNTGSSTLSNIASVTQPMFTSMLPYVYVIIGILIAFYFAKKLIDLVYFKDVDEGIRKAKELHAIANRIDDLE